MKFGSNLQAHLTPEWRSQYIDYEVLKGMLYDCKDEASIGDDATDEFSIRKITQFEEQFFAECDLQLTKVNTFFAEKLAESTRRFALLQSELHAHKESLLSLRPETTSSTLRRRVSRPHLLFRSENRVQVRTAKDLKLAFSEFYLNLILLQNYQELNFTGFRKILKKHDKMLSTTKGGQWRSKYVEISPFHKDSLISEYILKTENLYINDLEDGDRSKAMKRLRVPPLTDTRTYPKGTVFRVGLFLGMFLVIMAVAIVASVFIDLGDDTAWLVLDLYKAGFITFLFLTCLGFNIWGWRIAGVNHVLIFEIDPRQHLSHQHFFEVASIFSILWGLSLVAFLFGNLPTFSNVIPAYLNPGIVYGAYLLFLINPLPILFHKARFWLLKRFWRLFACGFYQVEFADFWIADQLNSLVVLFLDAEFLICFYAVDGDIWNGPTDAQMNMSDTSGRGRFLFTHFQDGVPKVCNSYAYGVRAIVACYPAYIRFVQCIRRFYDSKKWFPHLVNAGKYSTTFFRETFHALYTLHLSNTQEIHSVYFYLYLASLFINSCYTLAWDIKMDWGFLDRNAGENKFLREEIVYPHKTMYYLAILEDSIIRFAWVIKIAIQETIADASINQIVGTVVNILEVLRRFIWNFFRLENEHLNNCGEFRAVRDISVAPLRSDDLAKLERLMDDVCGADSILLKTRMRRRISTLMPSSSSVQIDTDQPSTSRNASLLYASGLGALEKGTKTVTSPV